MRTGTEYFLRFSAVRELAQRLGISANDEHSELGEHPTGQGTQAINDSAETAVSEGSEHSEGPTGQGNQNQGSDAP